MSSGGGTSRVHGDAGIAARLAGGRLSDVPLDVLRAGLRLPLHDYLGLELTGLRPVVVEVGLTEHTRSRDAPLHGGVVATLVDVAANIAAATSGAVDITRYGLRTARLEVEYHARPNGDRVRAEATVVEVERRSVRSRCTVTDGDGRRVASALVTVRVLPRGGVAGTGLGPDGDAAC
ncbi:MAG: PaaI family thioesterase [Pseudonocardia sp.]|nr:PaaI family thioesterase [Pseudonocardia sp.]